MLLRQWISIFFFISSQWLCAAQIYDCFRFFNEIELLKIRFEELYDHVDYFVLVEAVETFSEEPKPLYFNENKELFDKYRDKTIHIIIEDFPKTPLGAYPDKWTRQAFQLNAILRGLEQCQQDDIILISDLDEIPNCYAIDQIKQFFKNLQLQKIEDENQLICELHMRLFLFQLDWESPYGWKGAVKAVPYWLLRKRSPWDLKIFHMYDRNLHKIYDAGWHFHSMCGNKEKLVMKLRAIYRYNPSEDFVFADNFPRLKMLSNVEDWENHAEDFVQWTLDFFGSNIVPIDHSYPKYIQQNVSYFEDLGWLKRRLVKKEG